MKQLYISMLSLFFAMSLSANPGDTTRVNSHSNVHMSWYGNYDQWADFPSANQSYHKVLLRYTLGCPTGGCSDWDYTTQIFARKRTGMLDSNLVSNPSFRVNGNVFTSYSYSNTPTYQVQWNSTSNQTDTTFNPVLTIQLFQNGSTPTVPTDTIFGYACNFYTHIFDTNGNLIDSTFNACDATLNNVPWESYNVYEVIENYEIARMITPYSGNVPNTWKWTYTFDVTDYISLLQDSVQIRAFYGGYQDGFTATLDFEFIEGTPVHQAFKVEKLWQGSFPYGSTNDPIENYLTAKTIQIPATADHVKFRFIPTGHGFGGNENCAEFCPKNYYLFIDGTQRGTNLIWRPNCGINPVYPQGGTWVYDRANWCPGAAVDVFDHNISSFVNAGSSHTIDVNMQPFTNINNNYCSYIMEGQVFYYTNETNAVDAEVLEILAPSKDKNYSRFNPICDNASVIIRNTGSENLTSCKITYGSVNGAEYTYNWTGNLAFMRSDTVTLGNISDWSNPAGEKKFRVKISEPNGQADPQPINDEKISEYTTPPSYPDTIQIYFKTNGFAYENNYRLKDAQGNIIVQRSGMNNNTIYRDTVALDPGCYMLELLDNDGDGISFWANNDGTGTFRIQKVGAAGVLKTFGGDFGSSIIHHFTVGYYVGVEEETIDSPIDIFPNPTTGTINVAMDNNVHQADEWILTDVYGKKIVSGMIEMKGAGTHTINAGGLSNGIYLLMLMKKGNIVHTAKVMLQQ
jgi:hypothetical protein